MKIVSLLSLMYILHRFFRKDFLNIFQANPIRSETGFSNWQMELRLVDWCKKQVCHFKLSYLSSLKNKHEDQDQLLFPRFYFSGERFFPLFRQTEKKNVSFSFFSQSLFLIFTHPYLSPFSFSFSLSGTHTHTILLLNLIIFYLHLFICQSKIHFLLSCSCFQMQNSNVETNKCQLDYKYDC